MNIIKVHSIALKRTPWYLSLLHFILDPSFTSFGFYLLFLESSHFSPSLVLPLILAFILFLFFGHTPCWILGPLTRDGTTGPPGKSLWLSLSLTWIASIASWLVYLPHSDSFPLIIPQCDTWQNPSHPDPSLEWLPDTLVLRMQLRKPSLQSLHLDSFPLQPHPPLPHAPCVPCSPR